MYLEDCFIKSNACSTVSKSTEGTCCRRGITTSTSLSSLFFGIDSNDVKNRDAVVPGILYGRKVPYDAHLILVVLNMSDSHKGSITNSHSVHYIPHLCDR